MKKLLSIVLCAFTVLSLCTVAGCKKETEDSEGSAEVEYVYEYQKSSNQSNSSEVVEAGNSSNKSSKNKSTKTTKKKTSGDSIVPEVGGKTGDTAMDQLKSYDLKGYEFVIATYDVPSAGKNDYFDAVLTRNARVEKKLNCKIRYEYYDPQTFYKTTSTAIMAGDKVGDVLEFTMYNMGNFINSQLLYDINKLKFIDKKADCWDPIGFENTTIGSGTYGLLGPITFWRNGGGIFYNRKLIKSMGLEDPQALVKKNQWTWDKFKKMVSKSMKDLDNDGQYTANDQWACSCEEYDGIVSFFGGSGNNIFSVSNKKYTYNLDSKKSLSALTDMKNIFAIPGGIYNQMGEVSKNRKMFSSGKCVFYLGSGMQCTSGSDFAKLGSNLGVVPFPKGNNAKNYVSNVSHNSCMLAVPVTITSPDKTGLILQYLAMEAEASNEREVYRKYMTNGYQSSANVEIYNKYIYPNVKFDSAMMFKAMNLNVYNATECVIGNPIILDQANYTAAALIESYKDACVKFMNTINKK